jgi:dTDP-glucose pyrophosphorylase
MSECVGLLLCGGRGVRLGEVTRYVSKALVPVFDRPVFMYPLDRLRRSRRVHDIVILTNDDNDSKLRTTGLPTLIQDDARVTDMLSGLAYYRAKTGDHRPAVLQPCDNISDVTVDDIVTLYESACPEIAFSIRTIPDPAKLAQMGVFDPSTATMEYRPQSPASSWGVVAPYVIAPGIDLTGTTEEVFNRCRLAWAEYDGLWFDVGDVDSLYAATRAMAQRSSP